MGVSLKPSKQVSGGGFLNDVVADWVDPVWQIHDYNGKAKATTALCVTFHPEEGDITEQFFSAGSPDRLAPSSDGKTPAGTGAGTKGQYPGPA